VFNNALSMRVPAGPAFDDERDRFALRCCCEDCAHFDPRDQRCRHDWPTAPHRRAALTDGGEILFCKEFELC